MMLHKLLLIIMVAALPAAAQAQWLAFFEQTGNRLFADPNVGLVDVEDKAYEWGDVDNDGDTDLIVIRKKPFLFKGPRRNALLMNEGGALVDRTSVYAVAALDVADIGFGTPTQDNHAKLVDVNNDGWLDLVTANLLGEFPIKHLTHPRIYMNRGDDSNGAWLGFIYENYRFPSYLPNMPRFYHVAAGDFDEDGDQDLYFSDVDAGGAANNAPPDKDTNNRLLINDGTGVFSDGNTTQYFQNVGWQTTGSGTCAAFVDVNGDGNLDIVRTNTLTPQQVVNVLYNNIAQVQGGFFQSLTTINSNAPFFFSVGDLNNDRRPDLLLQGDTLDRYIQNTGINPATGTATWTNHSLPSQTNGFGGQTVIADLDDDGWKDLLIADVDVEIPGCQRTTNILRNGGANVTNEAQRFTYASNQLLGLTESQLQGVQDIAVFDINGDGCLDIVLGKCTGTQVWMQAGVGCDQTVPPIPQPSPPLPPPAPLPNCPDFFGNGIVGDDDLGFLLGQWGATCDGGVSCLADLNDDLVIGDADLGILLSLYGLPCPD